MCLQKIERTVSIQGGKRPYPPFPQPQLQAKELVKGLLILVN